MEFFITFVPFIVILLVFSIKQVNQYERWLIFTFWKFKEIIMPWWRLVIPVFQSLTKVDIRTKAVDVPDQEAITKDNIPVRINAVVYYKVQHAQKAILEVENFYWAVSQMAQTTMRNTVWEVTLDELLQKRAAIAETIKLYVDAKTDPWWVDVESVDLKDIIIPEDLKRTISKEAEAEREKRAVIIKSQWDKMAAQNLKDAADTLWKSPWALHLRTLQAINDLSSDQSNTTIWMVPINILEAIEWFAKNINVPKK